MNKFLLIAAIVCLNAAFADTDFSKTRFVFLNAASSQAFLAEKDEYTSQLSALDLSLYHSTKETIAIEDHLQFLKTTALDWTDQEKAALMQKIESFKTVVNALHLNLPLPSEVLLIKTNGEDAFHSHYTRRNGIIFPASASGEIATDLATFYHEMFHIMSRHNPERSGLLFSLIGFSPIPRVALPAALEKIRTTNPDAFFYDHAVKVTANNSEHVVIPFMYSAIRQDEINGPVDEAAVYRLGLLELSTLNDPSPVMYKVAATNYKEVVKANSHYYIHPEEILAEDFKLLLMLNSAEGKGTQVKYPDVIDQLREKLSL